jgi:hypothetical protein
MKTQQQQRRVRILLSHLTPSLLPLINKNANSLLTTIRSCIFLYSATTNIHYFTLLEPVIATAMMASFSVAYRRVKQNIITRLKNVEQDLLLENRIAAIMNACIRSNDTISNEALDAIMKELNTLIKLELTQIDDHVKRLKVIWYHPRTGKQYYHQVLLPVHRDLRLSDFKVQTHFNEFNEPIEDSTTNISHKKNNKSND